MLIVEIKLIAFVGYFHKDEYHNSIWRLYYEGISPPSKVNTGEVETVTATSSKCFAFICKFINLQDRAINFTHTVDYSILLYENVFSQGPGTISITSTSNTAIVIDKFCSSESKTPSDGQFAYFYGKINSTILQGSICNGGNSSVSSMIHQKNGFGSLSLTNFSNCISEQKPGFVYSMVESTANALFCNFENLKATEVRITQFWKSPGRIERCNYINTSQHQGFCGLVEVDSERLDIYDSSFQNNLKNKEGYLFNGENVVQIYIYRCSIDIDLKCRNANTSEKGTESFKNNLAFIGFRPCEGNPEIILEFLPKKENKICSLRPCINFLFGNNFIYVLLISK